MWKKYQETHSRSNLAGIRRMISRPNEGLPWLNPTDRINLAHDRAQSDEDEDEDKQKHYFGPSKYYCVEIACAPCGTVLA
jgi:hypothetical protein